MSHLRILASTLIAAGLLSACGPSKPEAPAPAAPAAPTAPPEKAPPMELPEAGETTTAPAAAIPVVFRGEWRADPEHCGATGESRLVIGASMVSFTESRGLVAHWTQPSPDVLEVHLILTGEGQTTARAYRFRRSADGRTLTDLAEGGLVRARCPGAGV